MKRFWFGWSWKSWMVAWRGGGQDDLAGPVVGGEGVEEE